MNIPPAESFRGTPPNVKKIKENLADSWPLWEAVVGMVKDCGATWRWIHSDKLSTWHYRAYLPGERFFVALTHVVPLEVSLNLFESEWDFIAAADAREAKRLEALRQAALDSGKVPAWLHVPIVVEADLALLAKLLLARGRRQEVPRRKSRGRSARA